MTDNYTVVYEFLPQVGGYGFLRTITAYPTLEYFQSYFKIAVDQKVIAQGVTKEEAENLHLLSPIIAYYTANIEEIFEAGKPKSWESVKQFLDLADKSNLDAITGRSQRKLNYTVPKGLEDHLDSLSAGNDLKARFMRAIISVYQINQDRIFGSLAAQNLAKLRPEFSP